MKRSLSFLFCIYLINLFPTFGSGLTDALQQPKKIQVKFLNLVGGEDIETLVNFKNESQLTAVKTSPYILKNLADSQDKYISDIEIVVALIFTHGKSSSFIHPVLNKFDEPLSFSFPFEDRKYLDRITVQIHGKSFRNLKLEEGKLNFLGARDPVILGAIWHPSEPGTTGWLYEDSLSVYFKQTESKDHPYGLTFGKRQL